MKPHTHSYQFRPLKDWPELKFYGYYRVPAKELHDLRSAPGMTKLTEFQSAPNRVKSGVITLGYLWFDVETGKIWIETKCTRDRRCEYRKRSILEDEEYRIALARGFIKFAKAES